MASSFESSVDTYITRYLMLNSIFHIERRSSEICSVISVRLSARRVHFNETVRIVCVCI